MPQAIERGALRCFRNSGQSCNAPTRMLGRKDQCIKKQLKELKKYTENSMKVGDCA